jgi:transposase
MSERHNRTYTDEFKQEALRLLQSSGKSAQQVERDLGITKGMLVKWRARYQVRETPAGEARLEPSDLEAAQREIRQLERELREVTEEREILHLPWRAVPGKKVVSIFSKTRP